MAHATLTHTADPAVDYPTTPFSQQPIRFGTDGWRAIIGQSFTFDNVILVTHAIANYLLAHKDTSAPVVIGFDGRFLARQFAQIAAATLNRRGFNVKIVGGYTPTPLVAHAAMAEKSAGALMFTASHNPPEYMGIKFIPEYAGPATKAITDAIVAEVDSLQAQGIDSIPVASTPGKTTTFDPRPAYVAGLKSVVQVDILRKSPIRLLYDSMYGAGFGYFNSILEELASYQPDMIHGRLDPTFGGQLPEPKAEYLGELLAKVPAGNYQVGIANDGDADRFGIIDETGTYLSNNAMMPMLMRYLYHHRGLRGNVVKTFATSELMNAMAEKLGIICHETPVGFKHVGEWMRQEDILIGGEESGGVSILGHIPEKDGILGALLTLEMMAVEQKPLSQIYQDTLKEADFPALYVHENLELTEAEKTGLMSNMRALKPGDLFGGRAISAIDHLDGVKLRFGSYDWIVVRPSGTEPIIRLYGESPDHDKARGFAAAVRAQIPA